MGVTFSESGVNHTWTTAKFSWNSVEARLAWRLFNYVIKVIDVDEFMNFESPAADSTDEDFYSLLDKRYFSRESITIQESVSKSISKPFDTSSVTFGDKFGRVIPIESGFTLSETNPPMFTLDMDIQVSMPFFEIDSKHYKPEAWVESISLNDNRPNFGFSLSNNESLQLVDVMDRETQFNREYFEALDVDSAGLSKDLSLIQLENIPVDSMMFRTPDMTVSDLKVSKVDLDFNSFAAALSSDSPVGYSEFKRFVPGDYEYTEALFKLSLTGRNGSQAHITDLSLSIDLPDVHDRGRVIVDSAGWIEVNFNRPFYVAPEVNATVESGSGSSVPYAVVRDDVTKDKCFVALVDPATRNFTTGTLRYHAIGY